MPTRKIRAVIADRPTFFAPPDMQVRAATRLMTQARVGSLMIVEEDRLIGIFTERDALTRVLAVGLDPDHTPVAEVMTAAPRTIDIDRPLGHALHMMYEGEFRHVPVTENGRVVGMVSARDALGPELCNFEDELRMREEIAVLL